MSLKSKADLKSVKVGVKLPFLNIEGNWEANDNEIKAAWELYVELITRITTNELNRNEGLLREALTSIHSVFQITRDIMKKYGPELAIPQKKGNLSFGYLAVSILNLILRPFLAYWHPLLLDYEKKCKKSVSLVQHEKKWSRNRECRKKLEQIRKELNQYADILAKVAGVPNLH